jgi:CRP-like cAMP-binding protein
MFIKQQEMQPDMEQTAFFHGATQDLFGLLGKAAVTQRLQAGETLFEQNDYDDRLYVLDEGTLEVSVYSPSGRKFSLNRLGPESVFGEIAIFDPGPRTAGIAAITACKLRYVRQSALIARIEAEPKIAVELLSLAGRRMRWMGSQIEDQVFLPPAARLAAKILYLSGEAGEVKMSQADLADFVGVSREVVSKTLSEWRREGLVDLARGRIMLRDVDALYKLKNTYFSDLV